MKTMTREQWKVSYRTGRIIHKSKPENYLALCYLDKNLYLGYFRASGRESIDYLTIPIQSRLVAKKIIDKILADSA